MEVTATEHYNTWIPPLMDIASMEQYATPLLTNIYFWSVILFYQFYCIQFVLIILRLGGHLMNEIISITSS